MNPSHKFRTWKRCHVCLIQNDGLHLETCYVGLMEDEIDRLSICATDWWSAASPYATPTALKEALEVRAELYVSGEDKKDAERFRWLIAAMKETSDFPATYGICFVTPWKHDTLTGYIDAARGISRSEESK